MVFARLSRRATVATLAGAGMAAVLLGTVSVATGAGAKPVLAIGQPAPDFSGVDSTGKNVSLADLKGKTVVLEWSNHECPYVVKHYASGNMQGLQKDATKDGVVWLTVVSSAPGEQGHVTARQADALTTSRGAAPTAVLLDPDGRIGRQFDARVTPHMFVIDKAGVLTYMGGIDDRPSSNPADIKGAAPFVRRALSAMAKGETVAAAVTKPYGCSIKYKTGA